MKDIVFYMTLYDCTGKGPHDVTRGFVIQKTAALYERLNQPSFAALTEYIFDEKTQDLEDEFGIHDWSTTPAKEVDGIGYRSYEVAPTQLDELLTRWRDWFVSLGVTVTGVFELPVKDVQNLTDFDIYVDFLQQQDQTEKSRRLTGKEMKNEIE
jgi:hypothetical protein